MNGKCCMVRELLPLYLEDLTTPETTAQIQAHLQTCTACQEEKARLEQMLPPREPELPVKKLQKLLNRRRRFALLLTALAVLLVAVSAFAWLTAPEYYTAEVAEPRILETEDRLYITFSSRVQHSSCLRTINGETGGAEYSIEAWTTPLDRERGDGLQCICIPVEEPMTVWFTQNNGQEDVLLYGEETGDARILLPRLALGSYVTAALCLAAVLAVAAALLRKTRLYHGLLRALTLPISWLSGTVIVRGFNFTSYHIQRDLAMIALISVTILIALQLLINKLLAAKKAPPYGGGAAEER